MGYALFWGICKLGRYRGGWGGWGGARPNISLWAKGTSYHHFISEKMSRNACRRTLSMLK